MAGNTKTIRQDIFCRKLAQGVPLKEIFGSRATPKVITVYEWMQESAEFRTMYAVAAGLRAERLAEECLEIAGALDAESTDAARRCVDEARRRYAIADISSAFWIDEPMTAGAAHPH